MSDKTRRIAIALGSNLGDRATWLHHARAALSALHDVEIVACSGIEETAPLDDAAQPAYLNQMLLVQSATALHELLEAIQRIERDHGRVRTAAKASRTLDMDIVWAEGAVITSDTLLVPHPGLVGRAFWHRGLGEVLGVDASLAAIAAASVHAGLDTASPLAGHVSA